MIFSLFASIEASCQIINFSDTTSLGNTTLNTVNNKQTLSFIEYNNTIIEQPIAKSSYKLTNADVYVYKSIEFSKQYTLKLVNDTEYFYVIGYSDMYKKCFAVIINISN